MFEAAAFGGLVLCEQLAKVLELKLPAAAIVPPLSWRCRHIYRGSRQLSNLPFKALLAHGRFAFVPNTV
jgi:hypothetical protein